MTSNAIHAPAVVSAMLSIFDGCDEGFAELDASLDAADFLNENIRSL